MTGSVPPAVDQAIEILGQQGPLPPAELAGRLVAEGFRVSEDLCQTFPNRFPGSIVATADGRLGLAHHVVGENSDVGDLDHDQAVELGEGFAWLQEWPILEPLVLSDVVVVDIETTGLDRRSDEVWQIAAVHMGSGEVFERRLSTTAPVTSPFWTDSDATVSLAEALLALDRFLSTCGAAALGGHRLGAFDLPFLEAVAEREGDPWSCDLPLLDLHALSMLVDPTSLGRTLGDLADQYEVDLPRAHHAVDDARATAQLIEKLLALVDPTSPNWALSLRVFAESGDPWSRLLPQPPLVGSISAALTPVRDELAFVADGPGPADARQAVREGFARLGLAERAGQQMMAAAVADAMADGTRLAVEAPTGTGKSLGYLVPAVGRAHGAKPVVVATATKVLQRQLRDDAARLRAAGVLTAPFRQIQGVANYLCTRDIAASIEARDAEGEGWTAIAVSVRSLAVASSGTWDEVTDGLRLRSDKTYARQRLSLATSASSCDRNDCEWVAHCPLYGRLEGIKETPGILSVNHAVVGGWVQAVRQDRKAPGDVLRPGRASWVFDEAHNLEDTLTAAWTLRTGSLELEVVAAKLWARGGPIRRARRACRDLAEPPGELAALTGLHRSISSQIATVDEAVEAYMSEFGRHEEALPLLAGVARSRPEYRTMATAARQLAAVLMELRRALNELAVALEAAEVGVRVARSLRGAADDLDDHVDVLFSVARLDDTDHFVHLVRRTVDDSDAADPRADWAFELVPIEIAEDFRHDVVVPAQSLVLTSATLRTSATFEFLADRLGLDLVDEPVTGPSASVTPMTVPSPFDPATQSQVVLTGHLPLPLPMSEDAFCDEFASDQAGFLSLTGGKTLTLFAARRRMLAVAERVRRREAELADRGIALLVQGEDSPRAIQERFRRDPGTVLYGLRSYWEGFDAPGHTLSYLVIEKPPYPHPSDPVIAARQKALSERGEDPFMRYVLPKTAISMAQGFGRLIRSEQDRGSAIIADRRLQVPSAANGVLLDALDTPNRVSTGSREEAWTAAIRFVTGDDPDLSLAIDLPGDDLALLLAELRLEPGEDPRPKLERAAREIFGIEQLRPEQLQIMEAILAGDDVLAVLPTGFGKSLCFQLPALLRPDDHPTVVVSPLVALIKDQVDHLRNEKGIRAVAGITGRTSQAERTELLRDVADGQIRLLYVSPERLAKDKALETAIATQQLAALIVDEAHCVSSWGHDFRPEFREIAKAIEHFERSPRVALTATATPEVADDIHDVLQMHRAVTVRLPVERADLRYRVLRVPSERERARELMHFVSSVGDRPGIVYASRRALTEELAWLLREAGYTARAYHAGIESPEQRDAIQEDFLAGTTQIIVATKAFGMGINKPDIGWVLHYDLPDSLEGYAQEAGRAARAPGIIGDAVLLFTKGDLATRRRQASKVSRDQDANVAQEVLDALVSSDQRAGDRIVDPEALAESLGIDLDVANVVVAWLEKAGNVERLRNCCARGHVSVGWAEPDDPDERRFFIELLKTRMRARVGSRRMVDFAAIHQEWGYDPDEVEARLFDWTLRRLVQFQPTRMLWRVRVVDPALRRSAFESAVAAWRRIEAERLQAMIAYATRSQCRRAAISEAFGDPAKTCHDLAAEVPCDICSGEAPTWHQVPRSRVPDPEELIDVETVVLKAVRWASGLRDGRYGEAGLRQALLGNDTYGDGRPLGRGLLSCPFFGALRYLRGAQGRLDKTIAGLIGQGLIERRSVTSSTSTYSTLAVAAHPAPAEPNQ